MPTFTKVYSIDFTTQANQNPLSDGGCSPREKNNKFRHDFEDADRVADDLTKNIGRTHMSEKNQQPLEGPGRHSGRPHPKAEKVQQVKLDSEAQKNALKNRQKTQDHK